jgi:hypothetical protein
MLVLTAEVKPDGAGPGVACAVRTIRAVPQSPGVRTAYATKPWTP